MYFLFFLDIVSSYREDNYRAVTIAERESESMNLLGILKLDGTCYDLRLSRQFLSSVPVVVQSLRIVNIYEGIPPSRRV